MAKNTKSQENKNQKIGEEKNSEIAAPAADPMKKTTIVANEGKIPLPPSDAPGGNKAKILQTALISASIILAGLIIAASLAITNLYVAKNYSAKTPSAAPTANKNNSLGQQANPAELVKNIPAPDSSDYSRGGKNPKVTVVIYSDLDCPYCQQFHETLKKILQTYGDKVSWVYRHFPLQQIHPNSFEKSVAAECAGKLGGNVAFWNFVDAYFKAQDASKNMDSFTGLAGKSVNQAEFKTCIQSKEFDDKIDKQTNEAISAGARGTPFGVLIAGQTRMPIGGAYPFEILQKQIDQLLK